MKPVHCFFIALVPLFHFCSNHHPASTADQDPVHSTDPGARKKNNQGVRTVHVFVALCDNEYQGIVPVGKSIGNGQDPKNNLYWGCEYGIRTYFKRKESEWILAEAPKKISDTILERVIFKHMTSDVYLLADAYNGKYIKETTTDFLDASAGGKRQSVTCRNDTLNFGGASDLVCYIGHDGLMDFSLPLPPASTDTAKREAIILACYSKKYFGPFLQRTGAQPLVWTTGLMAPEAYTLHDALGQWVRKKPVADIREAAAVAYSRYQHCSIKAARNLLVEGW